MNQWNISAEGGGGAWSRGWSGAKEFIKEFIKV